MAKLGRYSADRKKIEALSAAKNVEVADCGTIFMAGNFTGAIVLPSAASAGKGWWCKVVMSANLTAGNITIDLTGSDTIELVASCAADAAVTVSGGTAQVNIVDDTALKGDQVEVFTDGTSWYALACVSAAAAVTTS